MKMVALCVLKDIYRAIFLNRVEREGALYLFFDQNLFDKCFVKEINKEEKRLGREDPLFLTYNTDQLKPAAPWLWVHAWLFVECVLCLWLAMVFGFCYFENKSKCSMVLIFNYTYLEDLF